MQLSNMPPGLESGYHPMIDGPRWEGEVAHECDTCFTVQEFMAQDYSDSGLSGFCPNCDSENWWEIDGWWSD